MEDSGYLYFMSLLERNLEALQGWVALTAAQIRNARVAEGFERGVGSDGTPTYQRVVGDGEGRRVEWLGGTSMPRASAEPLTESLDVGSVNGIGLSLGTGYEWAARGGCLRRGRCMCMSRMWGWARMALEVCDLAEFFRAGKVILLVGALASASDELSGFVAGHLGFEPPTVLHPLATVSAERRNGLLSAGEAMVRRVVVERHAQVNALAGRVEEAVRGLTEAEIAFVGTPRYRLERPISGVIGATARVLFVDRHASVGVGAWLEAMVEHRPRKIVSDFFRAQIGCVPEQVVVETWVPPLVGAGFWERVPAASTMGAEDRVIVHGAWHAERLAERGIPKTQIEVRPLERRGLRSRSGEALERSRVALIGDLPSIEAEALGIELPTHLAVHAAVCEMIRDDYLTVHVGQAGDILRRALMRVGVPCEEGVAVDPAMREPMLRIVRDVLIPALPPRLLAEELMEQQVALRLIGDWPGVKIPVGDMVAVTRFEEIGEGRELWNDVAVVVHLSPTGMVAPLLLDAAAEGVAMVSARHPTDRNAGALAMTFTPDLHYAGAARSNCWVRSRRCCGRICGAANCRQNRRDSERSILSVGLIDAAEAAAAGCEIAQGFVEFFDGEFGPEGVGDVELGVADLPEEVVADAHFAGGADEEVGVGHAGGVEVFGEGLFGDLGGAEFAAFYFFGDAADGVGDLHARAVVDGEAEGHAGVAAGGFEGVFEFFEDLGGEAFAATDLDELDVVVDEESALRAHVLDVEVHEEADFFGGAVPVFRGEGVERELLDVEAGRFFDDGADGFGAGAVACEAWETAGAGPAAVAVHDDGDVARGRRLGGDAEDGGAGKLTRRWSWDLYNAKA